MPSNNDSQCYFVQLQIDGYLDGELNEVQQNEFMSHVHDCVACAKEFRYAQTVQDAVMELPQLECQDSVLEPIHRLAGNDNPTTEDRQKISFSDQLSALLNTIPVYFRYGLTAAVVAVVAVVVSTNVLTPLESPDQLVASEAVEQYSPEDISEALNELNVAIDYLNQVSQRTEVMIGDRFLVTPIQDSINASFERARSRARDPLQNGPI